MICSHVSPASSAIDANCPCCLRDELDRLRAELSRLRDPTHAASERYWEERWRAEKAENERLRAEVEKLRASPDDNAVQLHKVTALATTLNKENELLRAEVERLREALREVNENLPGSCTDEKSWLAKCLREVREIISDALASAAPKTERKFTGPGHLETTGYIDTAPKTEDPQ